jgi:hypothetical protein
MGLQLRNKSPKRRVKAKLREGRSDAVRPNDVWAMDFVHDQLATGRKLRILTVVGSGPINFSAPASKSQNLSGLGCAGNSGSIFKQSTPLRCSDFGVFDLADFQTERRHMPLK